MKVIVHRRFTSEQQRVQHDYALTASKEVCLRFREEIYEAMRSINLAPSAAGHPLPYPKNPKVAYRRRNLKRFPFFIIYAYEPGQLAFLWLLPTRSNPENWFKDPPLL
ncbi:hypothetical protein [Cephaloticoccus primus]|uniref:hypothetical protein n=1 Tax=Cephaloticoccus primus TaxID=1548207 RepID=UPI0012E732CC|nr:hypothetical protein [Cephaloticoccus primus]